MFAQVLDREPTAAASIVDIDEFGDVQAHVAGLSNDELLQAQRDLEGRRRADAAREAAVLAELDRRKTYKTDGHASMWGVLRKSASWADGCRVPTTKCETDHTIEFGKGGRTDPDDGNPGCKRHNLFRHNHRYQVMRDKLGEWHTYRPDGTEVQ